MAKTLILEGRAELVALTMAQLYRAELAKLRKKDKAMNMSTAEHDRDDRIAEDILTQLGWEPAAKDPARVEAVDDRQLGIFGKDTPAPKPRAKVACIVCARNFAVLAGDHMATCPDCGTIHRVKSSDTGDTVYQRRKITLVPDDIRALMDREQDATGDETPLTALEKARLREWCAQNPDHIAIPDGAAPIPRGERVADPNVPGSGNPLRVDCASIHGSEVACDGFDTTDTQGTSLCPKCGRKVTVKVVNDMVVVSAYDPTLDDDAHDAPDDAGHEDADDADDDERGSGDDRELGDD